MGFEIINNDELEQQDIVELTVEQENSITDCYANNKSILDANITTFIKESLIIAHYNLCDKIKADIYTLMTNGYVVTEASYDENMVLLSPEVKEHITTKTKLFELIKELYSDRKSTSIEYIINSVIKWYDGSGTATWTDFLNYFKSIRE